LWADALAGRLSIGNLADFTLTQRERFAARIAAIPPDIALADMDATLRHDVVAMCRFGFSGVRTPKVTKVAALYRPKAVPVLDGYVAMAFGYRHTGFSEGAASRDARIAAVVGALADWLAANRGVMAHLRNELAETVPDLYVASDLRLLDIITWTTQDDRMERPGKAKDAWIDAEAIHSLSLHDMRAVPVPG
jgi:hypothetical protein